MEIKELPTEQRNPASMRIDQMTAAEIVKTINDADLDRRVGKPRCELLTGQKEGIPKMEKSGSTEVQEFCHHYNIRYLCI